MDILKRLGGFTFWLQHNPNCCASPFSVRLMGKKAWRIDGKPERETGDILGYGKTFEEAAERALDQKKPHKRLMCLDGVSECRPSQHSAEYCAGCGG